MTTNEHWIDETFEELSSRGATFSDSFTDELEERLMDEQMKPRAKRHPIAWAILITMFTVGIGAGAYANGNAIKEWIYGTFVIGADGTVRNEDGDLVGESYQREDGTTDTFIQLNNGTAVIMNSSQINHNLVVEGLVTTSGSLKATPIEITMTIEQSSVEAPEASDK